LFLKRLVFLFLLIISVVSNAFQMKREAYIDIPTVDLDPGLYINVSSSYPIKDVNDVKFDPNIGIDFTYDNFGGVLKWYDGLDIAVDLTYRIFSGSSNIPGLSVGISEIALHKFISTAGTDEVFNDEKFADRPPEAWSFYIVAGKKLNRLIEVNAGLGRGKFVGYGSLSKYANTDIFTGKHHEVWVFGLFGGLKVLLTNSLFFIAEGDGRDINIGLKYKNKLIKGTVALSKLETFGDSEHDFSPRVGFDLSYGIMDIQGEIQEEGKKFPVVIKLIDEENREPVEGYAMITNTKGDTIEVSEFKDVHSFRLEPGIHNIFITAEGYKNRETTAAIKGEKSENLYTVELSRMEKSEIVIELGDSAKTVDNFEDIKGEIEGLSIKFHYGNAELTVMARDILNRIIELIRDKKNVRLLVIGHTCSIGTRESNQILSEKRAENVKKYLVENGVSADKIRTEALGERRPIADNSTEKGRIKNRRAEFVLYRTGK